MKKYMLLLLGTGFCLIGCETNLEEQPLSFLEESNSFISASDANSAVSAVYDRTRAIYNMRMTNLADVNGDEVIVRPDASTTLVELDQNRFNAGNSLFDEFYTFSYQAIDRANRIIERVPGIAMDTKLRDQVVGEAKFLRALHYFNLVRAFGDVPLVTKVSNDVVNVLVSRTSANQVYQQITQDLLDVEKVLPVRYAAPTETGRATVGAAKSLLAKVYLTRKDWANAAAKAKEVIDSKAYSLVPDYRDIFLPEKENGPEHIFSVQYSCVLPQYGSGLAENFAIYFSYPINQTGGAYQSNDAFYNSFPQGDYRRDVSLILEKRLANGTVVASRTGPHFDKYWDPQACGSGAARNNFIVLRYADVLLMYAEALNELNGPTADAYASINQVRARARNGRATAQPQDLGGLTKEQFRDAVLQERSWELSAEGHRRWDLLRTGKYQETMRKLGIPADDRFLVYPIPINERDVNPALTQNPGY